MMTEAASRAGYFCSKEQIINCPFFSTNSVFTPELEEISAKKRKKKRKKEKSERRKKKDVFCSTSGTPIYPEGAAAS